MAPPTGQRSGARTGCGLRIPGSAPPGGTPVACGFHIIQVLDSAAALPPGTADAGYPSICWANSVHSRRLIPLVSCVTASPASMRFTTATIWADNVTAFSR